MSALRKLSRNGLVALAEALESKRVHPPYSQSLVRKYVPGNIHAEVAEELQKLSEAGMKPEHIALLARLLSDERASAQSVSDRVELVWSGMEEMGTTSRDTSVIVKELFRSAKKSVLVSSFVVDVGEKARSLFGPLAEKMDNDATLSVSLYLNVQRSFKDETAEAELLRRFADSFRTKVWPGERLPVVYHDPRSLAVGGKTRACLHAKCVVIDQERAFVTSANFTEAAQERNLEAGVLIADPTVGKALQTQFDSLVVSGVLKRVPGL